jgi:hypothetical protein
MNYPLPPEPAPDEPLRATWGAQLVRWARANTLLPTPGMLLSRTACGTSFRPQAAPPVSAAAATPAYPWQGYLSPWTGGGTDPYAATRAQRFKLQRGKFAGETPSNMSDEFVAFGDITDTGITVDDAVYTQVYLSAPVSESSLGAGDVTYGIPTLNTIEGPSLNEALAAASGIPMFGSDGSLPSAIIVPICEVQLYGGAIYFPPGTSTYLDAILSVTGGSDCEHQMRRFTIVGVLGTQSVEILEVPDGGGGSGS